MIIIFEGDGLESSGRPVYHCVFDGLRCRLFEALRRRNGGLYLAIECVVTKNYKNSYKCSRFEVKSISKRETHHCPFDGNFCKHVRGCQDVLFFSNFLPLPCHCSRAAIRRVERGS